MRTKSLKPTTRALISIAKERRSTLHRGAASHAEGTVRKGAVAKTAEARYRKAHADGLRSHRAKLGRSGAIDEMMRIYRKK